MESTPAAAVDQISRNPKAVLAVVLVAYLLIILDHSIMYTGLPEIGAALGMSPIALTWAQNAYLLTFGGCLLLSARAGDLLGFRPMLLSGIALFSAASIVIGLAMSPATLITARAVQGIGASIIAPSVLSLISLHFPAGESRSRALAMYSMVAGAGASLGMVVGGIFAGALSWRVGFLINAPIGVALWFAARRVLANTRQGEGRLDLGGAFTSTLGMVALVWGIVRTADHGWADPLVLGDLLLAALLLATFVWLERRHSNPLLPLAVFFCRVRAGAYIARMCFIGAAVSFFFFETQLLQRVLGFSPVQAGLGFLPMTIPTFMAGMLVPRLTRRWGNANLVCLAMALMALGMFWLSLAGEGASYWTAIAAPMVLIGFGNGFGLGPLTVAGVSGIAPRLQGAASGAVNAAHQLGGSLGLSILATAFASAASPHLPAAAELAHQVSVVLLDAALLLGLGFLVCLLVVRRAERRTDARAARAGTAP